MTPNESQAFHQLLSAVLGFYGKPELTQVEAEIWWEALKGFDLAQVRQAMTAHVQHPDRGRFAPKPADIIAAIQSRIAAQWPTADEAWALALEAADERNTVVWTEEAAKAFAVASPVLESGDKVGARMAFKGAYERMVQAAIQARRTPQAVVSLGWDTQARVNALEGAVASGLLTKQQAAPHLLAARRELDDGGKAVAGLLTGKVVKHPRAPEAVKRRLAELRQAIANAKGYGEERITASVARREREAAIKDHARSLTEGAA